MFRLTLIWFALDVALNLPSFLAQTMRRIWVPLSSKVLLILIIRFLWEALKLFNLLHHQTSPYQVFSQDQ